MPIPHAVSLILFDIDGTLLWPKGAGRTSTRLAMLEVFGEVGQIESHYFGGKTDWSTLLDLLGGTFPPEEIERRMPDYQQAAARHLSAVIGNFPVQPCPAAHDTVAETRRRGLLAGIVTGNVQATAPIKLRTAGFDPDWFPVGAYGSEHPDRNRLPALALQRAEQHLGRRIAPQEVVVVGDTAADVACARALGAIAVAVRTGYATAPGELDAAAPDYLLDDLSSFYGAVIA
jgi:phosphoglycolate phosphatase